MTISKEDFHKLASTITEAIREHCGEVGRRAAEDMVHRVLDVENADLRRRVETQIRQLVAEEVGNHLDISVRWK